MRALARTFLLLASTVWLAASSAAGTVTPTWTFQTFGLQSYGTKRVVITPLAPIANNGNQLAVGDPIRGTTTNSSFTTNLLNGSYYRVEFFSGFNVYTLTNFFDVNTTNAVDGGDPLYRAYGQNQDRSAFAFSGPYSMSIFMLKTGGVGTNEAFYGSLKLPVGTGSVGDVWTLTNATTGAGEFQTPTGGVGGGSGNVIGGSSSTIGAVAVYSSTDGKHIGDGGTLGSAAFQPSSAFEPSGSASAVQAFATAYSNSVNVASGNSAAVSTNRFATPAQVAAATNSLNGANIYGQVPAASLGSGSSISTKFLRGDLTWQSIVGGGDMLAANNLSDVGNTTTALANLNGVRNSRALTINGTANQLTSSSGAQDLTADRTWTLSFPNAIIFPGTVNHTGAVTNQSTVSTTGNSTNFSDTYLRGSAVITGGITNAAITASSMVKADANQKLSAAAAGTDYVAPATALTIAGTANQITSSAGAQDLSTSRTWTFSLANTLIAPGTFTATTSITNGGIYYGNGSGLSNLDATQLTGTVPLASLPASVVTNNGPNTLTADFTVVGTVTATTLNLSGATANTLPIIGAGKSVGSLANPGGSGTYALTNNGLGGFGWAPAINGASLKSNAVTITDGSTNLVSVTNAPGVLENANGDGTLFRFTNAPTLNLANSTGYQGTNVVLDTSTLATTGNATNYTGVLRSGLPGIQTIYGANTNINLSLVGTNLADVGRTFFINNYTSTVNCNLRFTFTCATNAGFAAVVSNGFAAYINIHNPDTTGTNVSVMDAGRLHH